MSGDYAGEGWRGRGRRRRGWLSWRAGGDVRQAVVKRKVERQSPIYGWIESKGDCHAAGVEGGDGGGLVCSSEESGAQHKAVVHWCCRRQSQPQRRRGAGGRRWGGWLRWRGSGQGPP